MYHSTGPFLTLLLTCPLIIADDPVSADECDAHWDQSIGQPGMYGQTGPFVGGTVLALETFDYQGEEVVYAGGTFTQAGTQSTDYIAIWDGSDWLALPGGGVSGGGPGVPAPYCMTVHDDGNGESLYVGGAFTHAGGVPVNGIARYDGEQWSAVGLGFGGSSIVVRDLAVFQDQLYAVGSFTTADGLTANKVARWNGSEWHKVGGGLNNNASAAVVFNDGTGEALYVGGVFTAFYDENGATVSSPYLAKWDGNEWSTVSDVPLNSHVFALEVFDDGSGPALFAGGLFNWAGSQWVPHIAKWDGAEWSNVGGGVGGSVRALQAIEHDGAHTLYVGGDFALADPYGDYTGPHTVNSVTAWDGSNWFTFGYGVDDTVRSIVRFDRPEGPQVLVGGAFLHADNVEANHIAIWQLCPDDSPVGDLNGDGVVDVSDLLILLAAWGPCGDCNDCPADLNDDCAVDVSDLLMLLVNWG